MQCHRLIFNHRYCNIDYVVLSSAKGIRVIRIVLTFDMWLIIISVNPLIRNQERLLQASAAPNYIHNLPIPTYPPTQILPQETFEMKRTALAPFHAHAAGVVSWMYSSHFPEYQLLGNQVNALLHKELSTRIIDTTTDFIYQIFSKKTEATHYRQHLLQDFSTNLS